MAFQLNPGQLGFKIGEVLVGLKQGTLDTPEALISTEGKLHVLGYAWNPDTLDFEAITTSGDGLEVTVTNRQIQVAGAITPVADAHTRIHRGEMYRTGLIVASLANAASLDLVLTTPADDWPHLIMHPVLDGAADLLFYEAPTFTGGTALTPRNLKRTSTNTWGGTVVHTPSVSDVGTLLAESHSPGGTGPHASGSGGGFDEEWVLKADTSYLIRLTNRSGQARRGSQSLVWYVSPLIPDA